MTSSSSGVDDHLIERPDFFVNHLDARYLDRPPKLVRNDEADVDVRQVTWRPRPRRVAGARRTRRPAPPCSTPQHLLLEEGYAAVTSRRVAARAGLKPQLVHYYFRTMDDLFLALVRRGAEQNLERQARALASPHPLRALWDLHNDPVGTTLTAELFALANHRKALRAELAAYAEQFRRLQSEALATVLEDAGVDPEAFPPEAVMVLMTSVSRSS